MPYCCAITLTIPKIDRLAAAGGSDMISFAGGTPRRSDFPLDAISDYLGEALSRDALAYGDPRGQPHLLDALTNYFAVLGIAAPPERLTVTSGAIAGLDLVFRCALDGDGVVLVEAPTYSDALKSLELTGARILELPMDEEGAQVDLIHEIVEREGTPRLIYVMPTFHNPTGVTMSKERRQALISVAEELDTVLVEDDAYGAFRFDGQALPALASQSQDVIHVHSLSKLVAPGLRIGCVVGPEVFIDSIVDARAGIDICASTLNQEVVARFITGECFQPHVHQLMERFRARRDAMFTALDSYFAPDRAVWTEPEGGMFLWMRFPPSFDCEVLLPLALEEGVAFVPGTVFSPSGNFRNALRLSFGGEDKDRIAEGIRRLRAATDRMPQA